MCSKHPSLFIRIGFDLIHFRREFLVERHVLIDSGLRKMCPSRQKPSRRFYALLQRWAIGAGDGAKWTLADRGFPVVGNK